MFIPAAMGLTWCVLVGGTAISLELSGIANGAIVNADISMQLFATINLILSPIMGKLMSFIIVILLLTYLVTSADSAILVINTIASAGNRAISRTRHIIIWGLIFIAVVATLLAAGGMGALRSAMIFGALPFSLVMALMTLSLLKSLFWTHRHQLDGPEPSDVENYVVPEL
jgi:choline-glycine betaine transporter